MGREDVTGECNHGDGYPGDGLINQANKAGELAALLERADAMLSTAASTGDPTSPERSVVLFCVVCCGRDLNDDDDCPCGDGVLVESAGRPGEELICVSPEDPDDPDDDNCGDTFERFVVRHDSECALLKLRAEIVVALGRGKP